MQKEHISASYWPYNRLTSDPFMQHKKIGFDFWVTGYIDFYVHTYCNTVVNMLGKMLGRVYRGINSTIKLWIWQQTIMSLAKKWPKPHKGAWLPKIVIDHICTQHVLKPLQQLFVRPSQGTWFFLILYSLLYFNKGQLPVSALGCSSHTSESLSIWIIAMDYHYYTPY